MIHGEPANAHSNASTLPLRKVIAGMVFTGLYLLAIAAIKWLDIPNSGIETSGPKLLLYNAARASFPVFLSAMFLTCGTLAVRAVWRDFDWRRFGLRKYFICAFFLGASLLAWVMLLVGAAGLYSLTTALLLTVPLIALAPLVVGDPLHAAWQELRESFRRGDWQSRLIYAACVSATVFATAAALVVRVLSADRVDNDVWEHYLHYYRAVVEQGGIAPNELWYHFYLSKGASLFFLSILLTDLLGAPLVTWTLLLPLAVILYDLLLRFTRERIWAWTGVALLYMFLATQGNFVISFHKHHFVLTAYLGMILWAVMSAPACKNARQRWIYIATAAIGAAYLSFYLPASGVLVLLALGGLLLASLATTRREARSWAPAVVAGAVFGGASAALLVNYVVTGLAEMTPSSLFWSIANKERFGEIWNRYCIEYYFIEIERVTPRALNAGSLLNFASPGYDWQWMWYVLRLDYFARFLTKDAPLLLLLVVVLFGFRSESVIAVARRLRRRNLRKLRLIALACGAVAGMALLVYALPNAWSVRRMFVCVVPLMILLVVPVWSVVLSGFRPSHSLVGAAIALVALIQPVKLWKETVHAAPYRFAVGAESIGDALRRCDVEIGCATTFDELAAARRRCGSENRTLHLSYDPGPGYVLPRTSLLTEPSYGFGKHYDVLLFGSADEGRAVLEDMQVTHVGLNLSSRFFVGIPYGPLLDPRTMDEHFEIAWQSDDYYLLQWKSPNSASRLPRALLQAVELKRTHALSCLRTPEFEANVRATLARNLGADPPHLDDVLQQLVAGLQERWEMELTLQENRELVRRILARATDRIVDRVQEGGRPESENALDAESIVVVLCESAEAELELLGSRKFGREVMNPEGRMLHEAHLRMAAARRLEPEARLAQRSRDAASSPTGPDHDQTLLCGAAIALFGAYLALHFLVYALLLKRGLAFRREKVIFLYHFVPASATALAAIVFACLVAAPLAWAAAVLMIAVQGIYSLTFLELWALADGSYSLRILTGIIARGHSESEPELRELARLGAEKTQSRLAGLERLNLLEERAGRFQLTWRGRIVAGLLQVVVFFAVRNPG